MGNLRDQLKKANLISKKEAKRLAHEERVHRSKIGGAAGVEQEQAAREAELRTKMDAKRAADRAAQERVQAQREAAAELVACTALLQSEARKPGRGGAGKWYFRAPHGALPCLELPAVERAQLQEGLLCVVRIGPQGSHDYGLLAADHAARVARVLPDRVVWSAAGPEPRDE